MQNDPETTTPRPSAEDEARRQAGELKETLHSCGDRLKEAIEYRARDMGDNALRAVASSISAYGSAFERASEALDEQQEENAAHFVRHVSQSLQETASTISNASPEEAVDYACEQVRVRPLFALGCAFTIGLALSRLLAADPNVGGEYQENPIA